MLRVKKEKKKNKKKLQRNNKINSCCKFFFPTNYNSNAKIAKATELIVTAWLLIFL